MQLPRSTRPPGPCPPPPVSIAPCVCAPLRRTCAGERGRGRAERRRAATTFPPSASCSSDTCSPLRWCSQPSRRLFDESVPVGAMEFLRAANLSASIFTTLGIPPSRGRALEPGEDLAGGLLNRARGVVDWRHLSLVSIMISTPNQRIQRRIRAQTIRAFPGARSRPLDAQGESSHNRPGAPGCEHTFPRPGGPRALPNHSLFRKVDPPCQATTLHQTPDTA